MVLYVARVSDVVVRKLGSGLLPGEMMVSEKTISDIFDGYGLLHDLDLLGSLA